MGMPSSFISLLRAIAHPSFPERTMTGLFLKDGLNTRSQLTKKLLASVSAKRAGRLNVQTVNGMNEGSSKADGHAFCQFVLVNFRRHIRTSEGEGEQAGLYGTHKQTNHRG